MSVFVRAAFALSLCAAFLPATANASRYLQCVPFARDASGIDIRGNAKTWWSQAAGRYERGNTPREGSVLTLPGSGHMRLGHVAMVSKVVNAREILLTHANWSRRGGIERNVRAVDVSDSGDWSRVKIWFAGNGDLGTTSYPAYGFIYANAPAPSSQYAVTTAPIAKTRTVLLSDDVYRLASSEQYDAGPSSEALLR
jgi:surface antigen